jgi:hypothetical protein
MLKGLEAISPVEKAKVRAGQYVATHTKEIQNFINAYLRSRVETGWKFVTSAGADLNISTPVVKLGVVGSGGALYLQKDGDAEVQTLRYGGLGGSFGGQLIPIPFNFDLALKEMPSNGIVFKGPLTNSELSIGDFRGPCLIYQASYQAGPGYSGSLMLMGGSYSALLALAGNSVAKAGLEIITTCKAVVAFQGMNVNLFPFGGGVSCAIGGVI